MTLTPQQRLEFANDLRDAADLVERGDVSSAAITYIKTDGDDIQGWILDGQTSMLVGATEMLKSMIIDFELTFTGHRRHRRDDEDDA